MNNFLFKKSYKTIAEAAEKLAKLLPEGGIVTAEYYEGTVSYSSAGALLLERGGEEVEIERAIFEIGSLTKVFTCLLLALAVVKGRVSLGSTLSQFFSDLSFEDPNVGGITLHQLATHTSGLPRDPDTMTDLVAYASNDDVIYTQSDLLSDLSQIRIEDGCSLEHSYSRFGKGTTCGYSNFGVGLLGEILSRVFGESWEKLVAKYITVPLGMVDTVASLNNEQIDRLMLGCDREHSMPSEKLDALAGCGVLRSTAHDLILFGRAILNPVETPIREALDLLLQPQNEKGDIGLGVHLWQFHGCRIIEHGGLTSGYSCAFAVLPELGSVRVVLTNNSMMMGWAVMREMYDEKTRYTAPEKIIEEGDLTDYEGVYYPEAESGLTGHFIVVSYKGNLWAQLSGNDFFRLCFSGREGRFFIRQISAEYQFTRENDKIVSLTLIQGGGFVAIKSKEAIPQEVYDFFQKLDS